VKHLIFSKVQGSFNGSSALLQHAPGDPCLSRVEARIDVSGVNTGDRHRDEHLRGPEFFGAEKFPSIIFQSKKFSPPGRGKFFIEGDLELHGVRRPIVLQVSGLNEVLEMPNAPPRMVCSATTKINRKDFGLEWSPAIEAGGVLVGNEIEIKLELEFIEDGKPIKAS
jgi:polyisoprenoid-binding protein YceI